MTQHNTTQPNVTKCNAMQQQQQQKQGTDSTVYNMVDTIATRRWYLFDMCVCICARNVVCKFCFVKFLSFISLCVCVCVCVWGFASNNTYARAYDATMTTVMMMIAMTCVDERRMTTSWVRLDEWMMNGWEIKNHFLPLSLSFSLNMFSISFYWFMDGNFISNITISLVFPASHRAAPARIKTRRRRRKKNHFDLCIFVLLEIHFCLYVY